MNKQDIEILDKLLPSVADRTITKNDRRMYDEILQKEWDRINKDKELLLKYYPFAVYGL